MKLAIASDLHFDFYTPHNQVKIADKFKNIYDEVDLIVLAGDLVNGLTPKNVDALNLLFKDMGDKIIFVPGNHDFWGVSAEEFESGLAAFNGIALNNGYYLTHDRAIYGGPLWFEKLPVMDKLGRWIDFEYVRPVQRIFDSHKSFKLNLKDSKPSIVISHHAPSFNSVHPKYAGDAYNVFFASNQEELIKRVAPKLWIHGHTHTSFDYMIGDTRVICNPLGYPNERLPVDNWFPKIVEID